MRGRVGGTEWVLEPITTTWARYFPRVPVAEAEMFQYPMPASDGFWAIYAEPVDEFLRAANFLREALEEVRTNHPAQHSSYMIFQGLNSLAFRVSPAIGRSEDGTCRLSWVSTSLLGSFATMAMNDITEDKRLMRCRVCNTLFTTSSPRVRYCSKTCRGTAQKRAQRKRQREVSHA